MFFFDFIFLLIFNSERHNSAEEEISLNLLLTLNDLNKQHTSSSL